MARDKNNHYQDTASQIKQKIKQYMKRPAYLIKYMRDHGKLPPSSKKKRNEKNVSKVSDTTCE